MGKGRATCLLGRKDALMVEVVATFFPLLADSPESCACGRAESSVGQNRSQEGILDAIGDGVRMDVSRGSSDGL